MTEKPVPVGFRPEPVGTTLHLTPKQVWEACQGAPYYQPPRLADEAFIHCTNGEDKLLEVANLFHKGEQGLFLALDIELSRVSARAIYEDPGRTYPHIYGPIDRDAIVRVRAIVRDEDGTFVAVGDD